MVVEKAVVNKTESTLIVDLVFEKLNKSKEFSYLFNLAKQLGYNLFSEKGVLNKRRVSEHFVHFAVLDELGNVLPDSDGGYLTAYEPVFLTSKKGEHHIFNDCFNELIDSVLKISSILSSGRFIISGTTLPETGFYVEDNVNIEVLHIWKKKRKQFASIVVKTTSFNNYPKIDSTIFIGGLPVVIVSIG